MNKSLKNLYRAIHFHLFTCKIFIFKSDAYKFIEKLKKLYQGRNSCKIVFDLRQMKNCLNNTKTIHALRHLTQYHQKLGSLH